MSHIYKNSPDTPVTSADKKLSAKHHINSIGYNVKHATDHASAIANRLEGLKAVNPSLAKKHQAMVVTEMKELVDKATNSKGGMNDKQESNVDNKGESMQTTKKTGKFQGKSNALGGGGRSAQLKDKGLSGALISYIGRKRYGAKAMAKMAAKGRSRSAKSHNAVTTGSAS